MSYLRILAIPVMLSLLGLVLLTGCPQAPAQGDTTVTVDRTTPSTGSTTIIHDNTTPPPAPDTNVDVHIDSPAATTKEYVVVKPEAEAKYPDVVTVVRNEANALNTSPDQLDVLFVPDSPTKATWVETVRKDWPLHPHYVIRDFDVLSSTGTEATANAVVEVTADDPGFKPRTENVVYTLRKSASGQWLIWDIASR